MRELDNAQAHENGEAGPRIVLGAEVGTDLWRIRESLDQMEDDAGVTWRGNFWGTGIRGAYDLGQRLPEDARVVWWSARDHELAFGETEYVYDNMTGDLFMNHSGEGAAEMVRTYLQEAGFEIEWYGTMDIRLVVRQVA